MKVVSVLNQKGGSGKTTIALNISMSLHEMGFKVLLVDSDRQGSLNDWYAISEKNPLDCITVNNQSDLVKIKGITDFDYIVIDGMPSASDLTSVTIGISDFILIPVQPSPFDIWATSEIVTLIKNKEVKSGFVINRAIKNTSLSDGISKIVAQHELPVFKTLIYQRIIYSKSAIAGCSVFNYAEKNKNAISEINCLVNEIRKLIE